MDERQYLIQALEAELDKICEAMEPSELERFRVEFAALIPAVAAAQDPRAARKVLSDLRNVYGRYREVRERVLPPPVGSGAPPPFLRPADQPTKDLPATELAQVMQALCKKIDDKLQQSSQTSHKEPPREGSKR